MRAKLENSLAGGQFQVPGDGVYGGRGTWGEKVTGKYVDCGQGLVLIHGSPPSALKCLAHSRWPKKGLLGDTMDLQKGQSDQRGNWGWGRGGGLDEWQTRVRCRGSITIYQAVTGQGSRGGGHGSRG